MPSRYAGIRTRRFDRGPVAGSRPEGWGLWKGESFDQYDPTWCWRALVLPSNRRRDEESVKAEPRQGLRSMVAKTVFQDRCASAALVAAELDHARVAFRDVSARDRFAHCTRLCLYHRETFLTHKAPHLDVRSTRLSSPARVACSARAHELAFRSIGRRGASWRRSVAFFILEGLRIPSLDDDIYGAIAAAAARLSCPDERFADFATNTGVEVGPLAADERDRLRAEIDAHVAHAWGVDAADLETIFADFTLDAVPEAYRQRVRDRLAELA